VIYGNLRFDNLASQPANATNKLTKISL